MARTSVPPTFTPDTTPRATVATSGSTLVQTAAAVTSISRPRSVVPRQRIGSDWPVEIVALGGSTRTDTNVGVSTVTSAVPWTAPIAALTVAVPAVTPVTTPAETCATAPFSELQLASAVTSRVPPSSYAPVAVSFTVAPGTVTAVAGVTAMETRVAAGPGPPALSPPPPPLHAAASTATRPSAEIRRMFPSPRRAGRASRRSRWDTARDVIRRVKDRQGGGRTYIRTALPHLR